MAGWLTVLLGENQLAVACLPQLVTLTPEIDEQHAAVAKQFSRFENQCLASAFPMRALLLVRFIVSGFHGNIINENDSLKQDV